MTPSAHHLPTALVGPRSSRRLLVAALEQTTTRGRQAAWIAGALAVVLVAARALHPTPGAD